MGFEIGFRTRCAIPKTCFFDNPREWDGVAVYKPEVLFESHAWLFKYYGRRESLEQLSLAYHTGEDAGF